MKTTLYKADTRGHASYGWLEARYSFSFGTYYHPDRVHFGALRVLNDDKIAPGNGFGMHPHNNMEIVTIPLKGALTHKDSFGHEQTIRKGEVQVMSAGSGIYHSEYNASKEETQLLQIWILPEKQNIKPQYDQKQFLQWQVPNQWMLLVSPHEDDSLTIHQQAWISMGIFESGKEIDYSVKKKQNGVYLFLIDGNIEVENHTLTQRDALGVSNTETISICVKEQAEILALDIPLYIPKN